MTLNQSDRRAIESYEREQQPEPETCPRCGRPTDIPFAPCELCAADQREGEDD